MLHKNIVLVCETIENQRISMAYHWRLNQVKAMKTHRTSINTDVQFSLSFSFKFMYSLHVHTF